MFWYYVSIYFFLARFPSFLDRVMFRKYSFFFHLVLTLIRHRSKEVFGLIRDSCWHCFCWFCRRSSCNVVTGRCRKHLFAVLIIIRSGLSSSIRFHQLLWNIIWILLWNMLFMISSFTNESSKKIEENELNVILKEISRQ